MVLRPRSPPSSPAPSAHRDAASGLDRDAAVERWAWMPSTPQSVFRGYAMIRLAVRSMPSCGDLPGLARRCEEFCHRLDLHVAVLQLPFIILLQQHRTDQPDDGRSHNVANFEWRALLRRDSMKAHYGEGFLAGHLDGQAPAASSHAGGGADGAARETVCGSSAGFLRAGKDCRGMLGSRVRTRSPDPPTPGPLRRPQGRKSQGNSQKSAGRPKE